MTKSLVLILFFGSPIWMLPATLKQNSENSRIVGGFPATIGQFPFAAAIVYDTPNGRYFCGGTLISAQAVLTAGLCMDGANSFIVILGVHNLVESSPNRVTLATNSYLLPPNFSTANFESNIGLIKLRQPIPFSSFVRPIQLLATQPLNPYESVTLIGWGATSNNDETNSDLNWVSVSTITNTECNSAFSGIIADVNQTNIVCVNGSFNQGTCLGDSGSPLIQFVGINYYQIVGVSSFYSGLGCETADPSGFTKVYPFRDWIQTNVFANNNK